MSLDVLSDLDLDLDIDECLQNYPELESPLLDADTLDGLCLSDDLWANLDLQLLPKSDESKVLNPPSFPSQPHTCEEVPGITTPPQSPPDSKVPTTHSSSVPVIATASNTSTLQRNTSPSAQQEQPQEKPTPASTNGINTVIQVLKSGELVRLQVPTQVPATSKGFAQAAHLNAVKQESSVAGSSAQKRPHPDSNSPDVVMLGAYLH